MTRIAHVSDLHVLDLEGNTPWRFLNKRATGWVNLRYRRKHVHKREALHRVLAALTDAQPDHLVITGDLTNLALESEFEAVRRTLAEQLKLPRERVSVVPGNHDAYTSGSTRRGRFAQYFGEFLKSDRPDLAANLPMGPFPFVRLLPHVALIGLSSAIPTLPMLAAGKLGAVQLQSLSRILADAEVRARVPVVLVHHPVHSEQKMVRKITQNLYDARELLALLQGFPRAVLLHGHNHQRLERSLLTPGGGRLHIFGATSASLLEEHLDRRAGFNLYDIDARSVRARAMVLPLSGEGPMLERELPFLA